MGTITAELVETGEKRDARGRRMTPVQRRRAIVRAYRASGLTQAAFARREGLNYSTFAGWVLKVAKAELAKNSVQFAQLRVPMSSLSAPSAPAESEATSLEVRLVDGTSIRSNRVDELALLVRALRA
jgi:transposase-like protein